MPSLSGKSRLRERGVGAHRGCRPVARIRRRRSRSRARFWRWRRNPLKRRSDVVEAWLLLGAWVLAVGGGLAAGLASADAGVRSFDRLRAERHAVQAVQAVLTRDVTKGDAAGLAVDDDLVWAAVRWHAQDGTAHAGRAKAPFEARAGDRVTVWTDDRGGLVSAPPTHGRALREAAVLGVLAAGFVGGLAWAGCRAVRGLLMKRRMAAWGEAWARADLRWGGRTG